MYKLVLGVVTLFLFGGSSVSLAMGQHKSHMDTASLGKSCNRMEKQLPSFDGSTLKKGTKGKKASVARALVLKK